MRLRFLALAVSLALSPIAATAQNACLNFFQIAQSGPYGGGSYQLNQNTVIQLSLAPFWVAGPPPTSTFGSPDIRDAPCFGGPVGLLMNNTSLVINVLQNQPDNIKLNVNACNYGGSVNVSARLASPADFIGDFEDAHGQILPDAFGNRAQVEQTGVPAQNGGEAKTIFTGEPSMVPVIGGQELLIHSICVN